MEGHDFCRLTLTSVIADLKREHKNFKARDYWCYKYDDKHFEVQGPSLIEDKNFYWYGSAHCKWDARFQAMCQLYESAKPKSYPIRRVCSSCKKDLGFKDGGTKPDMVSHGLCEPCRDEILKDLKS